MTCNSYYCKRAKTEESKAKLESEYISGSARQVKTEYVS